MNKKELITLSALLHDIGKFAQLAGVHLEIDRMKLESLCPKHKENSTQFHSFYSVQFIEEFFKEQKEDLIEVILHHHCPEETNRDLVSIAKILAIADWLANGQIRHRQDEKLTEQGIIEKPLVSIFSQISLEGESIDFKFLPPGELNFAKIGDYFPVETENEAMKNGKTYAQLWSQFCSEMKFIGFSENYNRSLTQLFYLLEKYTTNIPSFSGSPNTLISLFHHLKITAAIAVCLEFLGINKIEEIYESLKTGKNESIENEIAFYLLGGDLSGIQDFIYSVTSKRALKGLRGRSFYLQLITEAVTDTLLHTLNLTETNILYAGGGNFFLMIPYHERNNFLISQAQESVDQTLLNAHNGKLSISISKHPVKFMDLLSGNFGDVLDDLKRMLSKEKRKKFSSFLTRSKINNILHFMEKGGNTKICEICSEELIKNVSGEDDNQHCELCQSFGYLANKLSNSHILIRKKEMGSFVPLTSRPESYTEVLKSIGYDYELSTERTKFDSFLINDANFLKEKSNYVGFKAITQYAPQNGMSLKTLEEFAQVPGNGVNRWGILRIDVDHLGKIFKYGLGKNQSITTISMLSHSITLFFTANVEQIAQDSPFNETVYIIYSGGDDMFVLGAWSVLPKFAERIYDKFIEFTGYHPAIHLSAGIYIAPSEKFPVYQAADSAGEFLDIAKNNGRNRINFLQNSIEWNQFNLVTALKDQIVKLLEGGKDRKSVPKSLLQILYSAIAEENRYKIDQSNEKTSMFRIWYLVFAFNRLMERNKNRRGDLTSLKDNVILNYALKDNLNIATRWAELLTK